MASIFAWRGSVLVLDFLCVLSGSEVAFLSRLHHGETEHKLLAVIFSALSALAADWLDMFVKILFAVIISDLFPSFNSSF